MIERNRTKERMGENRGNGTERTDAGELVHHWRFFPSVQRWPYGWTDEQTVCQIAVHRRTSKEKRTKANQARADKKKRKEERT